MDESELRKGLDKLAQQAIPATINLWPSIQSRLTARQNKPYVTIRLKMAGGALIAVIVIASLVVIIRPQPVSAAEILNRAVQVTQNAAASGIQSYQGIIDETHPETGFANLVSHWQGHVWEQSPNRFRIERFGEFPYVYPPSRIPIEHMGIISAPIPPLNVSKATLANLAVSDGVHTWQFEPGFFNTAVEYNAGDFEAPLTTYFFGVFLNPAITNPTDIQDVVRRVAPEYSNIVLGRDTIIAGRSAYTIQLDQKADDLNPNALIFTVWVDQETYLVLGYEERSTTGALLDHAAFSTLTVNLPVDPNVFSYTPPSEAKVIDLRPTFPSSAADLSEAWQQVKRQWGNSPLYAPTYVPPLFVSDRPQFSVDVFPVIFSPPNVIQRFYANGVHMITIRQSIQSHFENWGTDEYTIRAGPFTGELYSVFGLPKTLLLHADDQNDVRTNFLITADASVSKEELLKIGASLQEIPNLGGVISPPITTPTATP